MSNNTNYSLTTFSASGKLTQIDHAMAAVNKGQPTIGVKSNNGVVILSILPQLSPLAEPDSVERISCVTRHIGMSYSGLGGDFRVVLSKVRKHAAEYKLQYGEDIPVVQCAKAAAETCQEYTQRGGVRPFGCCMLISGYDSLHNAQLYQVDTAGTWWKAKATAIGKNSNKVIQFLEKRVTDELEIEDAIHLAITAAKEASDSAINADTVHIALARDDGNFVNLTRDEIVEYISES